MSVVEYMRVYTQTHTHITHIAHIVNVKPQHVNNIHESKRVNGVESEQFVYGLMVCVVTGSDSGLLTILCDNEHYFHLTNDKEEA